MRSRLAFWVQLASLAATGWLLWRPAAINHWPHYSASWVLMQAVFLAAVACGAAALITFVLYTLILQDPGYVVHGPLSTSTAAIWFAPSVILFAQRSPAAIVAALVLVINATRILYEQWTPNLSPAPPEPSVELFGLVQRPAPSLRYLVPSLAASFCLQTAAAAFMLRQPALAGLALATSAATLTVFAHSSRAVETRRPASLPRSVLGLGLTFVLAIGLTVGGMLPRFAGRGFGFGSEGGKASSPAPAGMPSPSGTLPAEPPRGIADSGFFGVVLWPEIKPYATLIAPMPQTPSGLGTATLPRPIGIPFSGEYWMYRWPFAHPPQNSFFERGNPADLSFSTTDHQPLQMEARHKLDQSIAVDCCRGIQVEVRNADRYPGTISLELYLIDRRSPREFQMWIGRAPVVSRPEISGDKVTAVRETLEFPMPSYTQIREFDEFKIVFSRDRRRLDKSAKVAIERFVLLPRL